MLLVYLLTLKSPLNVYLKLADCFASLMNADDDGTTLLLRFVLYCGRHLCTVRCIRTTFNFNPCVVVVVNERLGIIYKYTL